mmetsp:Transcript_15475/g.32724  ORF Transcript_15475/g.32724 Transcript_15475/m.32724 type:complete len:336 (+) Transcript_15475:71-1078(+)
MGLTMTQKKSLAIIPHVTGPLSFVGSCSILYDIWIDRKQKLRRPYYRILLGMSCTDAITSLWLGLSTWPIPRGTEGVYGAAGNTQTCTAQGFFIQLMVLSPMYNFNLCIYYLLQGKYQFTEEYIAKRYEKYMHAIAIFICFGFAILGLPLNLYNNANLWCWIAAYPSSCEDNSGQPGDVPCERGQNAWLFRWLIFYGPVWLIILAVTGIMIMLTRSVKIEEKRIIEMRRGVRNTSQSLDHLNSSATTDDDKPRPAAAVAIASYETSRYERSRQLFHQAVFYLGVFYLTWLFVTVNRMYQLITGSNNFALLVLHSIFGPLQGFLNFIVYRHGQITA